MKRPRNPIEGLQYELAELTVNERRVLRAILTRQRLVMDYLLAEFDRFEAKRIGGDLARRLRKQREGKTKPVRRAHD